MRKLLTVAVLMAGLVGLAAAQQPGRFQGGFGGGFGGGPTNLLRSKTVQTELKITDEQKEKLTAWAKEFAGKQGEAFKGLKDLPKEEIQSKMASIMAEMTATAYKEIGTVLDEKQVARLKQIDVQVQGTRALSSKTVAEAMKFTDDQKDKLKAATDASRKEGQDLREEYGIKGFGGPKLDADKQKEYDKKSAAITKELWTKVEAMLTDEQKKTWKELTGEPVDVAKINSETNQFGGFNTKKKKDD